MLPGNSHVQLKLKNHCSSKVYPINCFNAYTKLPGSKVRGDSKELSQEVRMRGYRIHCLCGGEVVWDVASERICMPTEDGVFGGETS